MKRFLSLLILIITLFSCTERKETEVVKSTLSYYDLLKVMRLDSSTWDMQMLENDLLFDTLIDYPVMRGGVFGTPFYSLNQVPVFEGTGTNYLEEATDSGTWVTNEFFYKKEKEEISFFTITFLMEEIDTLAFSHNQRLVISRNFPDYMCQGFFKEGDKKVEYLAIKTYDGDFYAIVNSRIYRGSNLRGRFVGDRLEFLEE